MANKIIYNGQEYAGSIINDNGVGEFTSNNKKKNPTGENSEIFNSYQGNNANIAEGRNCHAEGQSTKAYGYETHAEGNNTQAGKKNSEDDYSGYYSHAEGSSTQALGQCSHAEGYYTTASGQQSHAEGCQVEASGEEAHAEGQSTIASGKDSHAEGEGTKATQDYSHAEGYYTTASGSCSHAEGYYTTASGQHSHAEGNYTIASGSYSHAEGLQTEAYGPKSHASGDNTRAEGSNSITVGERTLAKNQNSIAIGLRTIAAQNEQIALGRYNKENTNNEEKYIIIVGNGTTQKWRIYSTMSEFDQYTAGDKVVYEGVAYECIVEEGTTTSGPFKENDWQEIANVEIIDNDTEILRSNAATLTWDGYLNVSGGYKINGVDILSYITTLQQKVADLEAQLNTYTINSPLTQAQYDALDPQQGGDGYDSNTIYPIV